MRIFNVVEIFDNDEFTTIVTKNSCIHLPIDGKHSITIQPIKFPSDDYTITVDVDLYQD